MKKLTLLCLLLFGLTSSCGKPAGEEKIVNKEAKIVDEETEVTGEEETTVNEEVKTAEEKSDNAEEEIKTEGFAVLMYSDYVFCCDLPENWEYSMYPDYSGEFYWLREHVELDESKLLTFYYSESDPDEEVRVVHKSAAEREPLEGAPGEKGRYTFADGTLGMCSLFDGDYYYKEYLYHPGTEYYVTLVTSKEDYTANEEQLRGFLDGISFEKGRVSKKESGDADEQYRLHIWEEDLQAEIVVPAGTAIETVWEQEERGRVLQSIILSPDADCESRMTIGESMTIPEWEERQWKRCRLASGELVNYDEFEIDGERVTDYWLLRSGCHVRVYGEETEELSEMLQSVRVR